MLQEKMYLYERLVTSYLFSTAILTNTDTDVMSIHLKWLIGSMCFTSHRQRVHLETAPPLTVPCEGSEARFYTIPSGNRTPGRRMAAHYTTTALRQLHIIYRVGLA